jgi:hypothetical protein
MSRSCKQDDFSEFFPFGKPHRQRAFFPLIAGKCSLMQSIRKINGALPVSP